MRLQVTQSLRKVDASKLTYLIKGGHLYDSYMIQAHELQVTVKTICSFQDVIMIH